MYNKIYGLFDKLLRFKVFIVAVTILTIINLTILCIITTSLNKWGNFFAILYPEEVYKELEDEADRMIQSGVFKTEDENFQLEQLDDDSKPGNSVFKLSEGNHFVRIIINNNLETVIERNKQPYEENIFFDMCILIIFSIFFALAIITFIIIVFSFVWFITSILHSLFK